MSGGQLMAGVGQCRRIGSWHPRYYRNDSYGYGYGYGGYAPGWGAGFATEYDY